MKEDKVQEILRPLIHESDHVYLLRRHKKRNWLALMVWHLPSRCHR